MSDLVVDALAVARITRFLVEDRVPFGKLRTSVLKWEKRRLDGSHGCEGDRCLHWSHFEPSYLEELLGCSWCASVWVGFGVLAVRKLPGWRPLAEVLAASEIAGIAATYVER